MESWIALSDREGALDGTDPGAILPKGTFILELDLPLLSGTVLIDFQTNESWPRAISVFADQAAGIIMLHRQGGQLARYVLPGPLGLDVEGTARIAFSWDGPGRTWHLRLEQPATGHSREMRGHDPIPFTMTDLLEVCRGTDRVLRHNAVQWFGIKRGDTPPERTPWIGLHTPIETPAGPRAAGLLRPGDLIIAENGAMIELQSTRRLVLPSRGTYSPILLRTPYFGETSDLLVSSDQLISMHGLSVEYLFGEQEVLAEAGHVTDGTSAMKDLRRAVTSCVTLDVGEPTMIMADGCPILSHSNTTAAAVAHSPHRVLRAYEAVPLLALLGRGIGRSAA